MSVVPYPGAHDRRGADGPGATTAPSSAEVRRAIDTVPDPEMPPVSVGDLGMVVDVTVEPGQVGAHVHVVLVPTFAGCPATAMIRADVTAAVERIDGVASARVDFTNHVVWTPGRITAAGREKLREFGIAPPGSGQRLVQIGGVTCPVCGSRATTQDSPFGPTACRSAWFCAACRNPFEAIKP